MNGQGKWCFRRFLRRVNRRWPWLKFALLGLVLIAWGCNLMGVGVKRAGEKRDDVAIEAPSGARVRVPEHPRRILEGKKLVALTFDDGPDPVTTPKLLTFLYEQNVPATFFMLGFKVREYPEIVRQVKKNGHEIASHGMWHQNYARMTAGAVAADVAAANAAFYEVLGETPRLIRPPYGAMSGAAWQGLGSAIAVAWIVDTRDWENHNTEMMMERLMSEVREGAIILMHDVHSTTVAAVPTLVKWLRDNGYEFVTVSEMMQLKSVTPRTGILYGAF